MYTTGYEMQELDQVANWNRIQARLASTPELEQYRDLIEYDWPEENEHAEWISTAPVAEIIAWAESLRSSEIADEDL